MSKNTPIDKELYNKVKKEAKQKFSSWPSAYASGWLVQEYKRRGGRYIGKKPSKKIGLGRWFDEKWVDVCYWPKQVSCGRKSADKYASNRKKFPYCRPMVKVTSKTPKTVQELTVSERKKLCSRKRKNPSAKIKRQSRDRRKRSL